jgi:hypothetical protein
MVAMTGTAVGMSPRLGWAGDQASATSMTAPRFPLPCTTVITPREVSQILKRHVVAGRLNVVLSDESTCGFKTYANATDDVFVKVIANPADLAPIKKRFPIHEVATLDGLGRHVAVIAGKHVDGVVAIFGSWCLDVEAGTPDHLTHAYHAPQLVTLARRAYQNIERHS